MNFAPPMKTDMGQQDTSAFLRDGPPSLSDEFGAALRVLLAGWRVIALFMVGMALLALAYVMITPPLYTARAELLLEPREREIVAGRVVDTGLNSTAVGADTLSLDSQIQVILSESVSRQLINEERLKEDPEFVNEGSALERLLDTVKGAIRSPAPARSSASLDPAYDAALEGFMDRLEVKRKSNTYVIGIGFQSEDPGKAARIANRVAQIYIAEVSGAALSGTQEAAEALEARLEALRDAANADSAAVEAYRRESGLTGSDSLAVLEQQLSDLNNQLSLARVARIEAEANLAQIRAAMETSSAAGLDAALLESPVITELQIEQTRLEAEEARLRTTYLQRHPRISDIVERKAALAASLRTEFRRIMDRLQLEFQIAADKEKNVADRVSVLESRRADLDVAAVRLRELERQAAASQNVYDTFLRRSKEVWEQIGLPNSNARVISEAFPPSRPSEPRGTLILLASCVLGLGLGIFFVWIRHVLRGSPPEHTGRVTYQLSYAGRADSHLRAQS